MSKPQIFNESWDYALKGALLERSVDEHVVSRDKSRDVNVDCVAKDDNKNSEDTNPTEKVTKKTEEKTKRKSYY